MFAKLYDDYALGQILLTKETVDHPEIEGETCPAINVRISAEGLRFGLELPFPPTEEGFATRDQVFDEFTEEQATKIAENIVQEIMNKAEKEKNDEESNGTTD
jgi:hypothetical protein